MSTSGILISKMARNSSGEGKDRRGRRMYRVIELVLSGCLAASLAMAQFGRKSGDVVIYAVTAKGSAPLTVVPRVGDEHGHGLSGNRHAEADSCPIRPRFSGRILRDSPFRTGRFLPLHHPEGRDRNAAEHLFGCRQAVHRGRRGQASDSEQEAFRSHRRFVRSVSSHGGLRSGVARIRSAIVSLDCIANLSPVAARAAGIYKPRSLRRD